ncbi:lipase family protein [Streptomyces sp. NPDC013953]|uniref:lipase family protein n=1 Tax=Streptomyces sp. NPDC013953 TaxID=3364868 RepID=UPI0036FC1384
MKAPRATRLCTLITVLSAAALLSPPQPAQAAPAPITPPAALSVPGSSTAPVDDPFFHPPTPVTAKPGTVIRSRTSRFRVQPSGLVDTAVHAWQLLYSSTDAHSRPIAVSGTLLVPREPHHGNGPRPIVAYAIGTHGLGDHCAPTRTLANGTDYEGVVIHAMLERGWAVAVTDYEGLGTPGAHTYANGRSQGQAVLDSLRAAGRLPGTGLSAEAPMAVTGYSQGGQAAIWAAELQPSYAPDLDLRAASVGAPAADLQAVAQHLDGRAGFGFGLAAGVGLKAAYPELRLDEALTEHGRKLISDVTDDCTLQIAAKYGLRTWKAVTREDILQSPEWIQRLGEQKAGRRRPLTPVRLYHSQRDDVIPYHASTELRDRLCALGATVEWQPYTVPTHIAAFYASAPQSLSWIEGRLSGQRVGNDC